MNKRLSQIIFQFETASCPVHGVTDGNHTVVPTQSGETETYTENQVAECPQTVYGNIILTSTNIAM